MKYCIKAPTRGKDLQRYKGLRRRQCLGRTDWKGTEMECKWAFRPQDLLSADFIDFLPHSGQGAMQVKVTSSLVTNIKHCMIVYPLKFMLSFCAELVPVPSAAQLPGALGPVWDRLHRGLGLYSQPKSVFIHPSLSDLIFRVGFSPRNGKAKRPEYESPTTQNNVSSLDPLAFSELLCAWRFKWWQRLLEGTTEQMCGCLCII